MIYSTEEGPCAYCGHKTGNKDEYEQFACTFCLKFFEDNPTSPVPPPAGTVLINLNPPSPRK